MSGLTSPWLPPFALSQFAPTVSSQICLLWPTVFAGKLNGRALGARQEVDHTHLPSEANEAKVYRMFHLSHYSVKKFQTACGATSTLVHIGRDWFPWPSSMRMLSYYRVQRRLSAGTLDSAAMENVFWVMPRLHCWLPVKCCLYGTGY